MAKKTILDKDTSPYNNITIKKAPECEGEAFAVTPEYGRALYEAGICSFGTNRLSGYFHGGSNCSPTHLLYMVISGEIICESLDESRCIKAGEMLVAPARGPHWIRLGATPCYAVWFHLQQHPHWDYLREAGQHVRKLSSASNEVEQTVIRFLGAWRAGTTMDRQRALHYEEILLICLEREFKDFHSSGEREVRNRLLRIWDRVREDPGHAWNVEALAATACFAPSYLYEVCRKQFGVTPMKRVAQIRVEEASRMLTITNLPLAEIASRVGYQTEFAFSDAFKRFTGIRPGSLRACGLPSCVARKPRQCR